MAAKKRSKTVWVGLAVAAILLAAIGVGWVLGSGGGNEPPPAATRGASGGPVSSTSAEGETDGVCGLPVGSQELPSRGPDATWEVKRSITVPRSEEYGPGIVKAGDRACFAHNPVGAAFFALNFQGLAPAEQVKHIKEDVSAEDLGSSSVAPNTPVFTVRGFTVKTSSPDRAVVTLVYAPSGRTGLESHTSVHEWIDGDWKAVLSDPANTTEQLSSVESLDGFVAWGPQ